MPMFIEKLLEFNLWANTEIIGLCATLDEAQLAVEVLGTPGSIQRTIAHLVRSEGTYLRDLGGAALWSDEVDWEALTLIQLLAMAQQSGAALLARAGSITPETRCEFIEGNQHYVFPAWTVLNQTINHGIEHRTQLRVLLTKLEVPHPGQSVWQFSEAIGAMEISDVEQE